MKSKFNVKSKFDSILVNMYGIKSLSEFQNILRRTKEVMGAYALRNQTAYLLGDLNFSLRHESST